jgi:hypothetical protein
METCVTIADSLDRFRVNMRVLHGEKSVVIMKTNFKAKEQRAFVDAISQSFEMWFHATITEKSDECGNCVLTCETINGKHMFLAIANVWSIFEKEIVLDY